MSGARPFFDTNVPLHLLSAEIEKADRAEELLAAGGIVSVQVLNEIVAVATRKLSMPWVEVHEVLAAVRAACTVAPPSIATHERGLELAEHHGFAVYDSLIVAAAILAECDVLYSEDMQDGRAVDRLTIRNPFKT